MKILVDECLPEALKELYRRGEVSSGRAAELLGMSRLGFIQHASGLRIPYLRLDEQELEREMELGRSL